MTAIPQGHGDHLVFVLEMFVGKGIFVLATKIAKNLVARFAAQFWLKRPPVQSDCSCLQDVRLGRHKENDRKHQLPIDGLPLKQHNHAHFFLNLPKWSWFRKTALVWAIFPHSHNEDMPEEKQLDPESELPHMPSNVGDPNNNLAMVWPFQLISLELIVSFHHILEQLQLLIFQFSTTNRFGLVENSMCSEISFDVGEHSKIRHFQLSRALWTKPLA